MSANEAIDLSDLPLSTGAAQAVLAQPAPKKGPRAAAPPPTSAAATIGASSKTELLVARMRVKNEDGSGEVPLQVAFDATGPSVLIAVSESKSPKFIQIPFKQSSLQKQLFEKGKRYWSQWQKFNGAKSSATPAKDSAAEEAARKDRKTLLIVIGVLVALVFVAGVLCVLAFMKLTKLKNAGCNVTSNMVRAAPAGYGMFGGS